MLPKYGRMAASSRYRLMQYLPLFQHAGYQVEVLPLLDDQYTRALYSQGRRPMRTIIAGYAHRLRQIASVETFDAVICEQEAFPYLPEFFESLLRRRARRLLLDYDDAAYVRYEQIPLLRNKIARLIASADAVVVGNSHLAAWAQPLSRRISVIPTVVDIARYPGRRRLPDRNIVRVVWIGTSITAPVIEPLLPAFEKLQRKHPQVVFRFIGSGSRIRADGLRIEALPWSEESETELLAECDLGIMPLPDTKFTRGKCGLKIIQYMASGLPVIASPVGVNQEIVKHGQNGFLASSLTEWEQTLCRMVEDPELRLTMGQAARQRVESEYTLEHGFDGWMEVFAHSGIGQCHLESSSDQAAVAAPC